MDASRPICERFMQGQGSLGNGDHTVPFERRTPFRPHGSSQPVLLDLQTFERVVERIGFHGKTETERSLFGREQFRERSGNGRSQCQHCLQLCQGPVQIEIPRHSAKEFAPVDCQRSRVFVFLSDQMYHTLICVLQTTHSDLRQM